MQQSNIVTLEMQEAQKAQDIQDARSEYYSLSIPTSLAGQRLDQALAELLPHLSRSCIQAWIKNGSIQVNTKIYRPKDKITGNEIVDIHEILNLEPLCQPQSIPLDIVYQDTQLIVINKPPGLVVHPAPGNPDKTLQNGLLYWDSKLIELPRYGIVHRLDKDTSGLLVIARTLNAYNSLIAQMQSRSIQREYLAVVNGLPVAGGTIDLPIGRHPTQRTKMAVVTDGKPSITHFQVQERFMAHSLLKVKLETGRTHQIRVHLSHNNLPIVGDLAYGRRSKIPAGLNSKLREVVLQFKRQALHAYRLSVMHPVNNLAMSWEVDLPSDMNQLIQHLRQDSI